MDENTSLQAIRRCWDALGEYRTSAVLVGGMAIYGYRLMPGFVAPPQPFRPLPTNDIDMAIPTPLPLGHGGRLSDNMARAGLVRRDVEKNGVMHTRWDLKEQRFGEAYVEFIAPSPEFMVRNVEVQPGTHAFTTEFAWMLLRSPWTVAIDNETNIRIPHPFAYFVQKILIRTTRPLDKRVKDLSDAMYVMAGFRNNLASIFAEGMALPGEDAAHQEQVRNAIEMFQFAFKDERASGSREVAFAHGMVGPPAEVMRRQVEVVAESIRRVLG